MTFVNTREACRQLGVHPNTLRNWDRTGKIKTRRTPGGIRLYELSSLDEASSKKKIIYARVSSRNQKEDLTKQIEFLRVRFPQHELIEDIGSGLNFKRKGFCSLIERILEKEVSEVVVVHKDRFSRFGFELINLIAKKQDCEIVVLEDVKLSPQCELMQDLLSIIHVFSCRLYGLRKYKVQLHADSELKGEST